MASQKYYVVGGEYADTSFTGPAEGAELEVRGPFNEREAKVCWRELTSKTVDIAMVRYFLKSEDEIGAKPQAKNFCVIGGEYANTTFTAMATGKELEVYGPFPEWQGALRFWRGLTSKSVDDALVRYDIRENYQPGDGIPSRKIPGAAVALPPTSVKSIAIAAASEKVFPFLIDGRNWPKWAEHSIKAVKPAEAGAWTMETVDVPGQLSLKSDAASGVIDHVFVDEDGVSWTVPGRVVAAGGGSVVTFVFTKPGRVSETQFAQNMRQLDDELATLKRTLEG